MATTKYNNYTIEKIESFMSRLLLRKHGVEITPRRAKSILEKRLRMAFNECLKGNPLLIGKLSIRLLKASTYSIPAEKKKCFVLSPFTSAHMYTLAITFKEDYSGYFYFKPSEAIMNQLKSYLSRNPHLKNSVRLTNILV